MRRKARWSRCAATTGLAFAFLAVLFVSDARGQARKSLAQYSPIEMFAESVSVWTVHKACVDENPNELSKSEKVFLYNESLIGGLVAEYAAKRRPSLTEDGAFEIVLSIERRVRENVLQKIDAVGCDAVPQPLRKLFAVYSDIRLGPVIADMAKRHGLGKRQ